MENGKSYRANYDRNLRFFLSLLIWILHCCFLKSLLTILCQIREIHITTLLKMSSLWELTCIWVKGSGDCNQNLSSYHTWKMHLNLNISPLSTNYFLNLQVSQRAARQNSILCVGHRFHKMKVFVIDILEDLDNLLGGYFCSFLTVPVIWFFYILC